MDKNLDSRESRMMDFIDAKNKEVAKLKDAESLQNNDELKLRYLKNQSEEAKSVCLDTMIGRVYRDALPFNDPDKTCSDADAAAKVRDFIDARSGHGSEWYVKEALKRNGSPVLKGMIAEAENISKRFYAEKAKNIGKLNLSDLNFNIEAQNADISDINRKMELDEVSDAIMNNVTKALQTEQDKAKKEAEYNQQIEDKLTADPNVVDDASMEAAMNKLKVSNGPKVYQPSLFEAVLIHNANHMPDASATEVMTETIHEYTLWNVMKTLRLENFTPELICKTANSYVID
jgi:hypothetical protein